MLFDIVLTVLLTLVMTATLNLIYDDNNNYYLNNDYNQSTNSNNINNANKKIWKLDSFSLTYNSNDWKEMTRENYMVLKYKNTENYIAYIGSKKNDIGLSGVKNKSFQNDFGKRIKNSLNLLIRI